MRGSLHRCVGHISCKSYKLWYTRSTMSITKSKRTKFTAAHLTPETNAALKAKARRQKKSVSAVVSEAIEEKLEREPEPPAVAADAK
jgi:predicted HicB family RNase H-like nuclease